MDHRHHDDGRRDPRYPTDALHDALGVPPEELRTALEQHRDGPMPDAPPVTAVRAVTETLGYPIEVGDRVWRSARLTSGDPQHGALMSTDHVNSFEAVVPRSALDPDYLDGETVADRCPECSATEAEVSYSRHHNIAGNISVRCDYCHEEIFAEDW